MSEAHVPPGNSAPDRAAATGRPAPSSASLIGQAPAMLKAGLLCSHIVLLIAVAWLWVGAGVNVAFTALLAGMTVGVLLMLGQYLQMILVQRADLTGLGATLAGFGLRVVALCAALWLWTTVGNRYPRIRPWGVVAGSCAVCLGWLAGVLLAYRRLRVPVYDEDAGDVPEVTPT